MLWMHSYMFYCSVRLGVMVIAIMTSIELLIPAILLEIYGISLLVDAVDVFQNDEHFKQNIVVYKILDWIDNHPRNVIILINIIYYMHVCTCFLAAYGALKLSKYFLLPFIFMELVRLISYLIFHITLMIVLKKIINLGLLVALTLLGGFIILFLAYNWCACVALFQILTLIRSNRYRKLYGDDPFAPQLTTSNRDSGKLFNDTIENIHVIATPSSGEVDQMKRKNNDVWKIDYKDQRNQAIIAVVPFNKDLNVLPIINKYDGMRDKKFKKFWNNSKSKSVSQEHNLEYPNAMNNGNWQWSELMVKGNYKQNGLIGMN